MAKRKSISKRLRFEIFKRDSFKCQYCGASAPDVLLEVDHIQPVSKGGKDDILNLITACKACNAGKSDRELDDNSAVAKQRDQLEELNERREQLEMMLAWRKGLSSIREDATAGIAEAWSDATGGQFHLNDSGLQDVRKWLRKFTISQILEAIDIAATQYLKLDSKGKFTSESANLALTKVPGIARIKAAPDDGTRDLFYIRGIIRNRLSYVDESVALDLLRKAHDAGASVEQLKSIARNAKTWTSLQYQLRDIIEGTQS